jgi:hypothetical protein
MTGRSFATLTLALVHSHVSTPLRCALLTAQHAGTLMSLRAKTKFQTTQQITSSCTLRCSGPTPTSQSRSVKDALYSLKTRSHNTFRQHLVMIHGSQKSRTWPELALPAPRSTRGVSLAEKISFTKARMASLMTLRSTAISAGDTSIILRGYQSLRLVPLLLVAAWVPFIWFITLDWKPIESQVMKTFQGLRKLTRDVVLKCRDFVLKRRAHRVSSRIGDDQSRLDVSNTSTNPATLASQETTGTIGSSPSQAGPSVSVGAQQVTPVQQPSTVSNSTSQNSTPDDEEVIEWEPLVFHEIPCCVFFWIPCTILYVVFHWLPRRLLCCL